jgi:CheY-like chemotaxis protein
MKRVLYIDDEANTEKMASKFEIMKDEGIEVIPVTRIQEVLPKLEELRGSIDLLIMDIIMPPEDYYSLDETDGGTTTGLRLIEDIRREYEKLPIIIVSVRRLRRSEELEVKYNIADFLEKPVSAFSLIKSIRRVIG